MLASAIGAPPMSIAQNLQQLHGELAAFVIAKNEEGIRRAYRELLRLGRSQQELLDEIIRISASAPKPKGTSAENLNPVNPSERDEELGPAAMPELPRTSISQRSPDHVTAAQLTSLFHVEETKDQIGHHPGNPAFRRPFAKPLIITALIAAVSIAGVFVFQGDASTPSVATNPSAGTSLDQIEPNGTAGAGAQSLDQTVSLAMLSSMPNALMGMELFSSRLSHKDEFLTAEPVLAVNPVEGGIPLEDQPAASASNVPRSISQPPGSTVDKPKSPHRKPHKSAAAASVKLRPRTAPKTVTASVGASTAADLAGRPATGASCPQGYVLYISACYPAR